MAQPALAANRSWNKIRYQGGTVKANVNPFDWNTTLKVTSNAIEVNFAGSTTVEIDARAVVALSYGEEAYHRVADLLIYSPVSRPVPLFGIIHPGKDRLFGIEFKNADGSHGALLLLIQKDSYRDLLQAVSASTGKAVEGPP